MNSGVITLITDFGTKDGYVGIMKGVMLRINPEVRVIDITHEIPPQDIFKAGFVLKNSYRYFPDNSIHLVVVDPGVGSKRRAILVEAGDHFFIGPDNGVFTFIYELETTKRVIELTNERYFLQNISKTFHGRDIFAPVAAHLSRSISPESFGDICNDVVRISIPKPEIESGTIKGIVSHIDSFGNLVSNIPEDLFTKPKREGEYKIFIGKEILRKVNDSYSEVKEGEVVAIFGSSGYLEISTRNQNAQQKLGLDKGCEIKVEFNLEP